jgi:hypothetical protein
LSEESVKEEQMCLFEPEKIKEALVVEIADAVS